ncbi:UNVERIFIED_CONTAM: hypothetical protein HDU68_012413 [Siphonaria sp. JEL0065]|nr:hypothetical protein HDU68_012413 [Siphonaria sp. JEL0065]
MSSTDNGPGYVQSVVLRERSLHDVNPALGSQHSDLHHRFIVIHLSSGNAKTTEYGPFEGTDTGTVRVHDGAQTIHAAVEAHEFETDDGKGYEWEKFHHWLIHESGFQNTPWSPDHHSQTFNEKCLEHLSSKTIRPEHISKLSSSSNLDNIQPPTEEATHIFHAVKKDVILKFHQLHHADVVHHTHIFDEAAHLTAYTLKEFGTRDVAFGRVFIGKIDIGNGHYLHVRVHKFHEGAEKEVEFYSIRMTRDSGIWSDAAPLVYFGE